MVWKKDSAFPLLCGNIHRRLIINQPDTDNKISHQPRTQNIDYFRWTKHIPISFINLPVSWVKTTPVALKLSNFVILLVLTFKFESKIMICGQNIWLPMYGLWGIYWKRTLNERIGLIGSLVKMLKFDERCEEKFKRLTKVCMWGERLKNGLMPMMNSMLLEYMFCHCPRVISIVSITRLCCSE